MNSHTKKLVNQKKQKTIKEAKNLKEYSEMKQEVQSEDDKNAIEFIEKHYPETAKEFQKLQFEQYNLFCKNEYYRRFIITLIKNILFICMKRK